MMRFGWQLRGGFSSEINAASLQLWNEMTIMTNIVSCHQNLVFTLSQISSSLGGVFVIELFNCFKECKKATTVCSVDFTFSETKVLRQRAEQSNDSILS